MSTCNLRSLLLDLQNGDPVEHCRPLRSQEPWKSKLVAPQSVRRVYRGLWGDRQAVQSFLTVDDRLLGAPNVQYVPWRYRMDLPPKVRHRHRADWWSVYRENAVTFSTPPLKGRRPPYDIWSLLLMYEFADEAHRPNFWVNPLDHDWDIEDRSIDEHGQTFYVSHAPLPVTAAFVRLDKLNGTMRQRNVEACASLLGLIQDHVPTDEWAPEPRQPTPPPPKLRKFPARHLSL